MCFGNQVQTKQVAKDSNSTTQGPQWLTNAAQNNLNSAATLQSNGFTPYSGQQVAGFSPQQGQSFDAAGNVANSVNGGTIGQLTSDYATAGPQSVNAQTIASQMSPYMNQYVQMALTPQLQMQDVQFANQNKGVDRAAAMAGAFGDTGWGQLRGTTTQAQDAARQGLIGQAYNSAFNTAIGAGAQDAANNLSAQNSNAGYNELALGRQLTGANAMQGQQTQAAQLQNQFGGQQTAQSQAQLNALYNQWQLAQQYPFQTQQLMNQTLGAVGNVAPKSTNSSSVQATRVPDNSGYGMAMDAAMAFLADGGKAEAGKPYIVGERGPEVIVPGADSVVIPNEIMTAARDKRAQKLAQPSIAFGIAA